MEKLTVEDVKEIAYVLDNEGWTELRQKILNLINKCRHCGVEYMERHTCGESEDRCQDCGCCVRCNGGGCMCYTRR
jgi:hypothetical protein